MYDANGNLKQVIRVKYKYQISYMVRDVIIAKLSSLGQAIVKDTYFTIDLLDISIVFSLIDGYDVNDLLTMLDRRYAK